MKPTTLNETRYLQFVDTYRVFTVMRMYKYVVYDMQMQKTSQRPLHNSITAAVAVRMQNIGKHTLLLHNM